MDTSVLIRATWPYFKFSSCQLFQNGKKQTGSIISVKFPITNSDYFICSIISDQTLFSSQKFVISMGFSIEKKLTIISDSSKSEIRDKNTSLNQFKPVGDHLSEIIDLKKSMVLQNHNFLPFLAKLTFNTTWPKISTYQPLKLCNNV